MDARFTLFLLLTPLAAPSAGPGLPACSGPSGQLAARGGYLLCFDSFYRTAVWTAYEFTPADLPGAAPRPSHFRRDFDLPESPLDSDYRHSGYSRAISYQPPIKPNPTNPSPLPSCSPMPSRCPSP